MGLLAGLEGFAPAYAAQISGLGRRAGGEAIDLQIQSATMTYDVIVEPEDDHAYTVFAESLDRSGFARGTLAPRQGMTVPLPKPRPKPLRTMAAMGMVSMDRSIPWRGTGKYRHQSTGLR